MVELKTAKDVEVLPNGKLGIKGPGAINGPTMFEIMRTHTIKGNMKCKLPFTATNMRVTKNQDLLDATGANQKDKGILTKIKEKIKKPKEEKVVEQSKVIDTELEKDKKEIAALVSKYIDKV